MESPNRIDKYSINVSREDMKLIHRNRKEENQLFTESFTLGQRGVRWTWTLTGTADGTVMVPSPLFM